MNEVIIKTLQEKNILKKQPIGMENYCLLEEWIEVESQTLEIGYYTDGEFCIRDIYSPIDLNAFTKDKKILGVDSRTYKKEILKAIELFKKKNNSILILINS